MSSEEECQAVLDALVAEGLDGAWLVRRDGLMALGQAKDVHDDVTISAMTAAMTGAADVVAQSLGKNGFETLRVDVADGILAIRALDDEHILVLLLAADADVEATITTSLKRVQTAIA